MRIVVGGVKFAVLPGEEGPMADGTHPENPLADDFAPVASCGICGKPIEKGTGDVIITTLHNAVHAQCAARLAV